MTPFSESQRAESLASAAPGAPVRLALPKGRMQAGVLALLADAGVRVRGGARAYRPTLSVRGFEVKLLKPQNAVEMLHAGSRDVGFAGADWAAELGAELVELVDTGLDPVRLVAAAPAGLLEDGRLPRRRLVIATEYVELTRRWIEARGLEATLLRSSGATEVFPPEDADLIVDNSASGDTLAANGLVVVDELMHSSTRLFANPRALEEPAKRALVDELALLTRSVLEARRRVMVELNVSAERLDAVIAVLPCMDKPTIARLYGEAGYGVKAAVLRELLPRLVPDIKARGGTDIVVSTVSQIVP